MSQLLDPGYVVRTTAFALVYFATAKFSLWLAPLDNATLFWPPTGIALATILIFGYRLWPGSLLGALMVSASTEVSLETALCIGVSNTLEAVLGAYLLQRVGAFRHALDRLWDVVGFVVLAALFVTAVGATLGVASLWWGEVPDPSQGLLIWWTRWLGDSVGVLLIAPLFLTWHGRKFDQWNFRQILEVAGLLTLLLIVSVPIFGGWVLPPVSYPPEYLFFPFVAWAALRLGQRGNTLTIFVATAITIWDWSNGLGVATTKGDLEDLLELQSFLCVLAVTGMALAAVASERQKAEQLARGQAQALVKSIAFLTAAPDLDRFLEHVLRVMVEALQGCGGALWLPDHEAGILRLHLEYVEGRIITANDSLHPGTSKLIVFEQSPVPLDPDSGSETRFYSEGDPRIPKQMWQYLSHAGAKGLLSIPMILGTDMIGWITVRTKQSQMPDLASTIGLAEALASQAMLAIQMAKLGEQAKESAALAERNRIARDIHDTLAQGFTGVIVQLQAAEEALVSGNMGAAKMHISHASELARSSLAEARRSVQAVRPQMLEKQALPKALDNMVRRMTRGTGIRPQVIVQGQPQPLAKQWEDELMRIAQESVTNILKHAEASTFKVKLLFERNGVQLQIRDDGKGFDPALQYDGFGLIGMRERARRIGGKLTIESSPGQGTEIRVVLSAMHPEAVQA